MITPIMTLEILSDTLILPYVDFCTPNLFPTRETILFTSLRPSLLSKTYYALLTMAGSNMYFDDIITSFLILSFHFRFVQRLPIVRGNPFTPFPYIPSDDKVVLSSISSLHYPQFRTFFSIARVPLAGVAGDTRTMDSLGYIRYIRYFLRYISRLNP